MDSEIVKIATEATEKAAESLVPALLKKVLSIAGKKPTTPAPRAIKNRGSWERRNGSRDRRVSTVDQRLRTGFSLEYFRKTGSGKFDLVHLTRQSRQDLFDALVAEGVYVADLVRIKRREYLLSLGFLRRPNDQVSRHDVERCNAVETLNIAQGLTRQAKVRHVDCGASGSQVSARHRV